MSLLISSDTMLCYAVIIAAVDRSGLYAAYFLERLTCTLFSLQVIQSPRTRLSHLWTMTAEVSKVGKHLWSL